MSTHEGSEKDEEKGPDTPRMDEDEEGPATPRESSDGVPPDPRTEPVLRAARSWIHDVEATVRVAGADLDLPVRDDFPLEAATEPALDATQEGPSAGMRPGSIPPNEVTREHLKGLLEALVFASDKPVKPHDLAKAAGASVKEVRLLLTILRNDYAARGVQLDEIAGGWIFRTNAAYAPFVRDLTKQRPVKLSRAQIETLAILAYRQPITRPEIDEIRGVDSGAVLKLLLERDLIRILGKKDEPGRPILYGTTTQFLEFFGLRSLRDLPTLREFTELHEDSRRVVERELGDVLEAAQGGIAESALAPPAATGSANDAEDTSEREIAHDDDPSEDTHETEIADPAADTHDEPDDEDDEDDDDEDDDDEDDEDEDEDEDDVEDEEPTK